MRPRENSILQNASGLLNEICAIYDVQGHQGHNRNMETFFCDLLNRTRATDLRLTSPEEDAYRCLDLIDPEDCLGVIIVPAGNRETLSRKLTDFCSMHLDGHIRQLICLFPARIAPAELQRLRRQSGAGKASLSLWDLNSLQEALRSIDSQEIAELEADLSACALELRGKPKHLLPPLPPLCDHFIHGSRDRELEEMEALMQCRQPIFLWGIGGMGKTQTALAFAWRHLNTRRAYLLTCPTDPADPAQSLRETILSASFSNSSFTGQSPEQEYRKRLEILRREYAGATLIIDNLDVANRTLEEICGEPAYSDLTELDLQLIFTTRSEARNFPNVHIDRLSTTDLLRMMHMIVQDSIYLDKDYLPLIEAVEGHTLLVSLMAKAIEASWGSITPEDLLKALNNGFRDDDDIPEVYWDRNQDYKQRRIYDHMQALFDPSELHEYEQDILCCSTLLPAGGMERNLFRRSIPKAAQQMLPKLIQKGWLQENQHQLSIHPVVREVCRSALKPTDENCAAFLVNLRNFCDPNKLVQRDTLEQVAGCFYRAVEILPDQNGRWAHYAAQYWHKLGATSRALYYIDQTLDRLEKQENRNPLDMIAAYSQKGYFCTDMGQYPKALEYYEKALQTCLTFCVQDGATLANCYNNIGNIYGEQEDFQKALENHLHALMIAKNCPDISEQDLAFYFNNVGLSYYTIGEYRLSQFHHLEALTHLQRNLPINHPDIAKTLNHLGNVCSKLGDHGEALEHKLRALEIFEAVLPYGHPDIARSYNNVGNTYQAMGAHENALLYKEKALQLRQLHMQDHPDLALSYASMASTYIDLGELEKALEFCMLTLEFRKQHLPENHPQLALAYQHLGIVFCHLGDLLQAEKYLSLAKATLTMDPDSRHPYLVKTEGLLSRVRSVLKDTMPHA